MHASFHPDNQLHPVSADEGGWCAGRLALPMPAFDAAMTCAEVFEWFGAHPAQTASAIVDGDNRVVGIVNRLRFLSRYAQRYYPELYGRHPILKLGNAHPLIVDEHLPVAELATMLTFDWPDALRECFVVTRAGRYLGVGTCEALVRSKVELLVEREEQLKEALLRATDASRTKSNFLALMSHELRTPLNAIIGFSEILAKEVLGRMGNDRYREYAGDIHGAGSHLLALINDILDLSKAEAGRLDLTFESIDMDALFQDCLKLLAGRAAEHGLYVSARVASGIPLFQADALRMKQILLNLLSNAVKFTPAGGSVEMSAELDLQGGYVIKVRDTGIGMAPESIPIALEPFRQIASPHARNVEGTGLGLSLVKSLVEQHGGEIAIHSALKRGTTVELRFPASRTIVGRREKCA